LSVHLVSVDWGTSSLRLKAVDAGGRVMASRAGSRGILNCGGEPFPDVLAAELAVLLGEAAGDGRLAGGRTLPVLMSGMIGSRQGWAEAAYLRCPAAPADLGEALLPVATEAGPLGSLDVRIVPGMDVVDGLGMPDVMRGEETQVFGAMRLEGIGEGVFILPGTHSKRVIVEAGRIKGFRTYMTGEVFQALIEHTILGRLADGRAHFDGAFFRGVETAAGLQQAGAGPGDLLNLVFSARTRALAGLLPEGQVASYLSGALVGAELASHLAAGGGSGEGAQKANVEGATWWLIGEGHLCDLYLEAARCIGLGLRPVSGDTIAAAHWAIALAAGLVVDAARAADG